MKTKIFTQNAPQATGLLSQAITSNGFIFVAGQIHSSPDGKLIEGTTEEKVQQIMKNIEAILKAADVGLNNIVKVTIFVTDIAFLPELTKVYPSYFSEPFPSRESLSVK